VLFGRSKIDFGHFAPMFRLIADLGLSRFLQTGRWSASFTAPELYQARRFGAERDRLLLSIPNGGVD
jgi:hypothetical protein